MKWDRFKKNIGMQFQIEPVACHLDEHGNELLIENDDWILQSISSDSVIRLSNVKTSHVVELGKDHIYDFRSDPSRSQSNLKHGFLVLRMAETVIGHPSELFESVLSKERIYHKR